MKKIASTLLSLLLISMFVLGGCSSSSDASIEGPAEITVACDYPDAYQEYADYYQLTHEEKKVNLVPFQDMNEEEQAERYTAIKKLLDGENAPDVLFVDLDTMERLSDEGYLQPVDSFTKDQKDALDGFVPAITDLIKKKGNGTLYGLPLAFDSVILFYNKEMFDEAGLSYPTDQLTWDELYELARNFTDESSSEPTYGFSLGFGYEEYLLVQAAQRGLFLVDDEMKHVTVNTPEWQQLFTEVKDLIDEKIAAPIINWDELMASGEEFNFFTANPFVTGKAAMTLMDSSELNYFDQIFQMAGDEAKLFAWDIASLPAQADRPGYGGFIHVPNVLVINKNASNLALAWDFVSYATGDELSKLLAKSNYQTSARTAYIPQEGKELNYDALYQLEPLENLFPFPEEFMYMDRSWEVMEPFNKNIDQILVGKVDVKKGLEQAEKEMQAALDQLNEQEEKKAEEAQ